MESSVLAMGPTAAPPAGVQLQQVRPAAISVRAAQVTYPLSKTSVLNGLNMSVAEGSIYGLLGASGCGKTTLLTCIVGRRRLNGGCIRVLGLTPGAPGSCLPGPTIGYMPQDLALHSRFSVEETFRYFGWVVGMTKKEIYARMSELLDLLELNSPKKLVGQLSGGQQRRVSLAIALLHRPPILILDEPTVGVDPVLRQSIWDLLIRETSTGRTTVLITTHYIEEARQSHKVGLMRNGVILAEDSPRKLLAQHGCESMEDVFLKLSLRQQRQQDPQGKDSSAIPMVDAVTPLPPPPRKLFPQSEDQDILVVDNPSLLKTKPIILRSHNNIAPCTWKMVVFTIRNFSMLAVGLALPAIVAVLFGLCVGGNPRGLHLAVVNDDFHCGDGVPDFPNDCDSQDMTGLSCRYLGSLDKDTFIVDQYDDVPTALSAVRRGLAWGSLHFPSNYSHALQARRREGKNASNYTLYNSDLNVWLDMSNGTSTATGSVMVTAYTVKTTPRISRNDGWFLGSSISVSLSFKEPSTIPWIPKQVSDVVRLQLGRSALEYFRAIQIGCKIPEMTLIPMQINEPIYGDKDVDFRDFFAPAVILSIVYNMTCLYTLAGFVDDKRDGFMERSVTSGVSVYDLLAAHVLIDSIMMLLLVVITLVVTCGMFGIANNGSLLVLFVFCVLHGYGGMFQGYCISSIFTTDFDATFACMGLYFPTLVLSGMLWPLQGMHPALRNAVWVLPLNLSTTAIRAIMGRGWGLDRRVIVDGFLSGLLWLAFFVIVTLIMLRLKKNL